MVNGRSDKCAGFTLIELMVTTGIMVIISTAVLVNNSAFGGTVNLRNLAYDVALTIRQAQVYGVSVKRFGASFDAGYGVHFSASDSGEFILFADVNDDGVYTTGEIVTPPSPYTFARGYTITDIRAGSSGVSCAGASVGSLDIVFKRPEPDARIRADGNTTLLDQGCVVLLSPRGDRIAVLMEATGQISVTTAP